ncbi:MAG: beta-galactosidase trimerization domain-containing protein [Opitutales bacterium]|nr:beta-galactosidase trimerization domain-containing protein [Opitutales bacterium]
MSQEDPFLKKRYLEIHDSPIQQKFRRISPWPVGCVFIESPGMTMEDIRSHFRLMKKLGYTALKQCQVCRGTDETAVFHMAIDEGITPWWYGEGGWEDPTPEKLKELGLPEDMPMEELRENEVWLERQKKLYHERVDREARGESGPKVAKNLKETPDRKRGKNWVPSVQPDFEFGLADEQVPMFLQWLKNQYETIEALNKAWNVDHCMAPGPKGLPLCGGEKVGWDSWEHLGEEVKNVVSGGFREYRRTRDLLRYKADNYINWLRDRFDVIQASDPNVPMRSGGEMGLFLPFAARGTDMEGIAELMRERGSFYPSFHPAWHFEEVDFELTRPMYMQSSITSDWFKGGWNATWESTGGPQQMTGHKAPFVPEVREKKPGFTVDEGVMTQLMFSWIAGGYRGFGIWCWSIRTCGWEGGEFALLDRNDEPTERAIQVGKIGTACRQHRDELWQAMKEPYVGVFQDWDMEAMWAAAAIGGRDFFKKEPIRARIGASRAMIDANVPWEHVTGSDLRNGLAGRYKSIYLPAALALDDGLLEILYDYVKEGGRVVLDAPGGWYDYYGRVLRSPVGSPFEKLFGCQLRDFQYSRDNARPWIIDEHDYLVEGTTLDLKPTTADVLESYRHGPPAVTANRLGQGTATILTYEASRMTTMPGNPQVQEWMVRHALGDTPLPYRSEAIVYRLAAPQADHYFVLNDKDTRTVSLETPGYQYTSWEDPVSGESLSVGKPFELPGYSGRWIRAVKS